MTTSHRPTYNPAVAGPSRGSVASHVVSAKDQNGFTQMKYRQTGQASVSEMEERDLRRELQMKEDVFLRDKKQVLQLIEEEEKSVDVEKIKLLLTNGLSESNENRHYDDEDAGEVEEDELQSRYSSDRVYSDELELYFH